MKAWSNIQMLNRYRANQSKLSNPIRDKYNVMQILRFCIDPDQSGMSLTGSISLRQFSVIGAYPFRFNLLTKTRFERVIHFCEGTKEVRWMLTQRDGSQRPAPWIFFVNVHKDGTSDTVYKDYGNRDSTLFKDMLTSWNPNGDLLDKNIVEDYMQSVERCEFNTHMLLLLFSEIQIYADIELRSSSDGVGILKDFGYAKCHAKIKTNPLQVPYGPMGEDFVAQTMFTDDDQESGPGHLINGALRHVLIWMDIQFEKTTTRYYVDTTYSQLDPLSKTRLRVMKEKLDEDTYTQVRYFPFQKDESIKMLVDQSEAFHAKLNMSAALQVILNCVTVFKKLDHKFNTRLKKLYTDKLDPMWHVISSATGTMEL